MEHNEHEQSSDQAVAGHRESKPANKKGFWGDIEHYLRFDSPSQLDSQADKPVILSDIRISSKTKITEQPKDASEVIQEPVRKFNEQLIKQVNTVHSHMTEQAAAVESTVTDETVTASAGSKAITEEIRSIRNKYIAGKVAGKDLFDREGRIIVLSQAVITSEIIEKADQEGKLADLIVSMLIPGLGE